MKNDKFDDILKNVLEDKVEKIEPSPFMLTKIKAEVSSANREEKFNMKFLNAKKLVIIGAVCIMSVSAYAAMKMTGSVGYTNRDIMSIEEVQKGMEKVGFTPKYVEAFDNGFVFRNGGTGETSGVDENGDKTGKTYKTLSLSYENDKGQHVTMSAENGDPYVDAGGEATEGYTSDLYKFVPPNYELTEEDKAAQENGEMYISYGSEEVELTQMENYSWSEDGIYYSLIAPDCDLGEDGMVEMVNQIMAQ